MVLIRLIKIGSGWLADCQCWKCSQRDSMEVVFVEQVA